MATITIEQEWLETAQLFGDAESVIKQALRDYAIQQCQQRISYATAKAEVYKRTFHCSYETLRESVKTDEVFLALVESQNPLWELDALEWEYWLEEQQTWREQLAAILRR
jgi:hypothetical protein